jgi:hypothetical protein
MDDDLPGGPFGGMPLFGELARMFSAQGPIHWDAARLFAALTATGGTPMPGKTPAPQTRKAAIGVAPAGNGPRSAGSAGP